MEGVASRLQGSGGFFKAGFLDEDEIGVVGGDDENGDTGPCEHG